MSLGDRIATPDGKGRVVRAIFATIADRYDLVTVVLSYGRDRAWKRRLLELAAPEPGARVLDLATGTGDLAFGLNRREARVVGLDLTMRMIQLARARISTSRGPEFLVGDMQALPFATGSFDVVTAGYGLRNVVHLDGALDEILRVLRPGGAFWSLDFNRPSHALVRRLFLAYLTVAGGLLGWLLHRDPDTYRYIPASIRTYPGGEGVVRIMTARGFRTVRYYPVLGGLMAMHSGRKDEEQSGD